MEKDYEIIVKYQNIVCLRIFTNNLLQIFSIINRYSRKGYDVEVL